MSGRITKMDTVVKDFLEFSIDYVENKDDHDWERDRSCNVVIDKIDNVRFYNDGVIAIQEL